MQRRNNSCLILLLLFIFAFPTEGWAQRKIEHIHSDLLQRDPKIFEGNIFFSGNVKFKHEGSILTADTVIYFEKENRIIARSNARMNVGDTVSLVSYEMEYDGNIRKAFANKNVVLKDRKQTLETQQLIYDRNTNKAFFNTRSKIIRPDGTEMFSNYGVYDLTQKSTYFENNVDIETDEYTINGDQLTYKNNGVIDAKGPTVITSKKNPKNRIYFEEGTYDTKREEAFLKKNSKIYSNGKILTGDDMYFNQKTEFGFAKGNVLLDDPNEKRFLRGGYGEYYQKIDSAMVTEKPYIVKAFKNDSLYIAADTIIAKRDSLKQSIVDAFRKVRVFKSDMQAKCDSVNLRENIGQMHMYYDPVFWNSYRQITGDTIVAYSHVKMERLDSIHVRSHAFAISKTDSLTTSDFNQVKGRFMLGMIDNEELRYIKVEGNAESIIYVDDEDKETKVVNRIGINKSVCGIIEADFYDRIVNIIECNINGKGKLYPVSELPTNGRFLADFTWRNKERPKKWQDIFLDIPESTENDSDFNPNGKTNNPVYLDIIDKESNEGIQKKELPSMTQ